MAGNWLSELVDRDVAVVPGVGKAMAAKLRKADIHTVADLLLHAPRGYADRSTLTPLHELPLGEKATVLAEIEKVNHRQMGRKKSIVEARVTDGTGTLFVTWFNQPWVAKRLVPGRLMMVSGTVDLFRGKLQMKPEPRALDTFDGEGESLDTGRIVPIHPAAGGVAPVELRKAIAAALRKAQPIAEVLPDVMLAEHGLAGRSEAFAELHFPTGDHTWEPAHRRLVFDELFRIEVALALRKRRLIDEAKGVALEGPGDLAAQFLAALPFPLTGAQRRAVDGITADLRRPHPMHRLLQGEVGSGKTVVAVAALLTAAEAGYQGAVMAPTEVLAGQHYFGIADLVARAGMAPPLREASGTGSLFSAPPDPTARPVPVALLTSTQAEVNFRPPGGTRRDELLGWIAAGEIDLVVGTHALIQEGVDFRRLGLAVVDEQHRFGVHQRVELREKGAGAQPHMLIMTATPIPRTLSMTLYGDLDVELLDEMPPGRTPVRTVHRGKDPAQLAAVYDLVRSEVAAGRQAFVVCPLVEDSDKIYAKSATAEHARLSRELPGLEVGLIHGQLHPREKDEVMAAFRAGTIDVLVATTVIEVGIDVPNATVMIIEDADRFGLSQLHQLRGRVGRGRHPATCVLVADPTTPDGEARIAAMVETTDGFRLAEEDLRIRGQGTVFGARQAGLADLKLADILRDAATLVAAREEAFALVAADPELADHPHIRDEVRALLGEDVAWLFMS